MFEMVQAGGLWHSLFGNLKRFFKWVLAAFLTGTVVGAAGCLFYDTLQLVTAYRMAHDWMLYLLPLGGLVIVFLYRVSRVEQPKGTDLVIESIRSDVKIPAKMAPLIFVSTALTHLFGGSSGREGAALQLGGSLGHLLARLLRMDDSKNILVMCGMSAAFAALFGTPLAATLFAMELVSVGVMYYVALVPCALSAIIASALAARAGIAPEAFALTAAPLHGITAVLQVLTLGTLCAAVSIALCFCLHQSGRLYKKYLPNQYLRIFVGGLLVIGMVFLFDTRDYLGAGMGIIEQAVEGTARPEAFLLKLLFTVVTLGAGFKGGEIVPTFFVGATFGCVAGGLLGMEPSLAAAIGMMAVFCGVTNCPVTALVMGIELFGLQSPAYFLLAVAVSYMLSGYYSLYGAQKIVYAKTLPRFINRDAH